MKKIIKVILAFLASVGFLTILAIAGIYFLISSYLNIPELEQEEVSQTTILDLKVGSIPFVDVNADSDIFSMLQNMRPISLYETVTAIKHAANDQRIKGILLSIEGSNITLAEAQELREALSYFKKSQKKVYAYAYSYGEGGGGTSPYYLATIADGIFMQPQGMVELTGYAIESYFMRDLLDKYKVKPQLDRRESYKGFIEPYTNKDFSPETKENLTNLLSDMLGQVEESIANRHNIKEVDAKHLVNAAPYLDTQAVDKKLITQLLHKEEVKELVEQELETKPTFATLRTYKKSIPLQKIKHKFALVSVDGEITSPVVNSPYGQTQSTPSRIAQQLKKAAEDNEVEAIILRINSPGGTVTGAETIWYEVDRIANKLGKPVIVSMGTLAASAGYEIAAPATKIIANPGTITGSIGVATGKFAIGEAASDFGINLRQIMTAKHSGMWSAAEEFTSEEWAKIQESLDHYYDIFLKKVSDGRHIPVEAIRKVAKGQVWTGKQAKEFGLVDELGGFLKAINVAKGLVNIPEDSLVEIRLMNEPSLSCSLFAGFFEGMSLLTSVSKNIKMMVSENASVQSKLSVSPR
ncbi:signal peptide peptidase SppA [Candidatus Paracaedibacter symbiosus]|uniref:signal peptide peptidase SppA n=1 Tax=Candidatus Paracaedibacter symbiosus TaxID=244582 RepID=UPI000509FA58|nr:signal peptide peptidase SppA [Candidatus Paracaedibacter symbiosus]